MPIFIPYRSKNVARYRTKRAYRGLVAWQPDMFVRFLYYNYKLVMVQSVNTCL